jgi:hypothetical protein
MYRIKGYKFEKVKSGKAENIEEFFEKLIKPQFENIETIKTIHRTLIDYLDLDNAIFFVRLYGSFPKNKYDLLRRGFVTQFLDGTKVSFCDNTFSMLFVGLKIANIPFSKLDLKDYLEQRNVVVGFGQTSKEKELCFYSPQNALKVNLNSKGWYQAHIKTTGYGYENFDLKKIFPNPPREEWDKKQKLRFTKRNLSENEKRILKAHFLRFIHPLNSFLVPKRNHILYSGNNIGEEPELINYVYKYVKQKFPQEYNEFDKLTIKYDFPRSESRISNIEWFEMPKNYSLKAKKSSKIKNNVTKKNIDIEKGENEVESLKIINLDKWLKSIGKEVFVSILYPKILENRNITYLEISEISEQYSKFSENSQKSRLSTAKSIFNNGMEEEALQIIIDSNRLDSIIREKAKKLLMKTVANNA